MSIKDELETSALTLASSPHLHCGVTIRSIMYDVIIALLPAVAAGVYFFGTDAVLVIASSLVGAVGAETLIARLRGMENTLRDGSAMVTGLLLGLCLPPGVPLWLPLLGGAFGIAVGKLLFGGLGMNIFNPALVGRAFLLASFPVAMTTWRWPAASRGWMIGFDALTTATPLDLMRMQGDATLLRDLFIGRIAGSVGETSALALLIGAAYLLIRGVIDWRIPVSYMATVMVLAGIIGSDPAFHLLAGGLILGACFMATDYVSGPVTPGGKLVFGVGCGIITMLLRRYGDYPEGVTYAILLMNATVPLIKRYTVPRVFGTKAEV
ncbi:MAG: RnfABCDGE type electron transport complex subunit D [Bacillota bacterium]